jgi:CHAT domain-containing protein/tetratricopeptide (TPR) repeat protein
VPPAGDNIGFSDRFQTDSRADYVITGTVTWETGALTVPAGASVARHIRAGSPLELDLALEFQLGANGVVETDAVLILHTNEAVRVSLRQAEGGGRRATDVRIFHTHYEGKKLVHRLLRRCAQEGGLKAGEWKIRYRYGLVRVEADGWPVLTAYLSPEPWVTAAMLAQRSGRTRCRGFRLSASAVLPAVTAAQFETLQGAARDVVEANRLAQASNFAAAVPVAERAVAICRRAVGDGHMMTIKARAILGFAYAGTQDPRSRSYLDSVLSDARSLYGVEHPETAQMIRNLAHSRKAWGDQAGALALYGKALEIYQRCVGEESEAAAELLTDMGDALGQREQYSAAADLYGQAVRMLGKVLGVGHPKVADLHLALGRLAVTRKDYATAAASYEAARKIYESAVGSESLEVGELLRHRGYLAHARGDEAAADADYQKALDIHEKKAGKEDRRTAFLLNSHGDLRYDQAKYDEAEHYHHRALVIFQKVYGNGHPSVAMAFHQLGAIEVARGCFAAARVHFEKVLAILQTITADVLPALSEAEGLEYVGMIYNFRDVLLSDLRALPQPPAEDAYRVVWQTRALVSQTVQLRVQVSLKDPGAGALLEEFRGTRRELAALTLAAVPPEKRAARQQKLAELAEKKEEQERELARRSNAFRQQSEARKVDFATLGRQLPPDVAVLEFFQAANFFNKQEQVYEAFVLRHREAKPGYVVTWVHLGVAGPINEAIRQWRMRLTGRTEEREEGTRKLVPPGSPTVFPDRRLRELVWDKLAPHLTGCATILIIPDGALARVPWAALPGKKERTYLLEEYAIGTASNGQQLHQFLDCSPRLAAAHDRLLLVGGVNYEGKKVDVATASPALPHRGPELDLKHRPRWGELPGTLAEIQDVAGRWGRPKADLTYLEGPAATKKAVLKSLPGARYIHLATHGFFADKRFRSAFEHDLQGEGLGPVALPGVKRATVAGRNPLILSGVVLAGANMLPPTDAYGVPAGDDGILTAEELAETDLGAAELVVLSACETGLGDVAGGEGVFGLQRAFHQGGARTVVTSLWKVHDGATRALMVRFYDNLWEKKMSKLEALREAQRWMLREIPRLSDLPRGLEFLRERDQNRRLPPAYWAAFVLSGDWR